MNGKDYRIGLLKSYGYLSGYIDQADFNIYNKALGTHNFGNNVKEDTSLQVESIIKLINQKNQLLNIYNVLTRALNSLNTDMRKLIVLRYVKKLDIQKVMQKLSITKGVYYGLLHKALDEVGNFFKRENLDEIWFFKNYSSKVWFRKLIDFASEGGSF